MEKTLLIYFRKNQQISKNEEKTNRDITFAGILNGNIMQIAGTKCNPKEQFEKKRARIIAEGRAIKKPIAKFETTNMNNKQIIKNFVEICKNLYDTKALFNG